MRRQRTANKRHAAAADYARQLQQEGRRQLEDLHERELASQVLSGLGVPLLAPCLAAIPASTFAMDQLGIAAASIECNFSSAWSSAGFFAPAQVDARQGLWSLCSPSSICRNASEASASVGMRAKPALASDLVARRVGPASCLLLPGTPGGVAQPASGPGV